MGSIHEDLAIGTVLMSNTDLPKCHGGQTPDRIVNSTYALGALVLSFTGRVPLVLELCQSVSNSNPRNSIGHP